MKKTISAAGVLAAAVLLGGCEQSNSIDAGTPAATNQTAQAVKEDLDNAWQKTKEVSTNAWNGLKGSVQSGADYTYNNKDAFMAGARADLDALDLKIKQWSDKAANAADAAKVDAQVKLQELHAQRAALDKKYEALKNSSDANWNDVKAGFRDSYDGMTNSLRQAWQWLDNKLSS